MKLQQTPARKAKGASNAAFTLVETMVSVILSAIMLSSLYACLASGMAIERITSDDSSAFASAPSIRSRTPITIRGPARNRTILVGQPAVPVVRFTPSPSPRAFPRPERCRNLTAQTCSWSPSGRPGNQARCNGVAPCKPGWPGRESKLTLWRANNVS
jgi:hypothetical protein